MFFLIVFYDNQEINTKKLIQHSCPDGMRNGFQFFQQVCTIAAFGVDYHIPDFGFSLQILSGNVDALVGENIVDVFQQTGHVFVNVQKTLFVAVGVQRNLREVNCSHG